MSALLLAMAQVAEADVPPVPGLCAAPVPADRDRAGCYKTGEVALRDAPDTLFWHNHIFPTEAAALAEAARHARAAVTAIHGQVWLYVLDNRMAKVSGGTEKAVIGPLTVPRGEVTAHFAGFRRH